MRVNDMISGVLLAICAGLLLAYSRTLPTLAGLPYGPGTFPAVIACGLLAGAAGLIYSGWRQRATGSDAPRAAAQAKPTGRLGAFLYALSVPAAIVAYMALTPVLGFPIVAFGLVAAMITWLTRRVVLAAVIGLCATGGLWLAFAVALHVPLPAGPF